MPHAQKRMKALIRQVVAVSNSHQLLLIEGELNQPEDHPIRLIQLQHKTAKKVWSLKVADQGPPWIACQIKMKSYWSKYESVGDHPLVTDSHK